MPIQIQVGILGDESLERWPIWCQTNRTHTIQRIRQQVNTKLGTRLSQIKNLQKLTETNDSTPTATNIRLLFNGQELLDEYTIEEYDLQNGNVILATLGPNWDRQPYEDVDDPKEENPVLVSSVLQKPSDRISLREDEYYTVGDYIDAYDLEQTGAWFPARIVDISSATPARSNDCQSNENLYYVSFDRPSLGHWIQRQLSHIRPRSTEPLTIDQLEVAQSVLAEVTNGQWFVAIIERIVFDGRTRVSSGKVWLSVVVGNGASGNSGPVLAQHVIRLPKQDIRRLRSNVPRSRRTSELNQLIQFGITGQQSKETRRHFEPDCVHCNDSQDISNCADCGCQVCDQKTSPDKQLVCDECDRPTHLWCLREPLTEMPKQDEWFCDRCRNQSQQELVDKQRKFLQAKRKHGPNSTTETRPDNIRWGYGMACARRSTTEKSNLSTTFGPIPNVPVGSWWRFRVQASEASVHAPLVAGIHGKEKDGAYSVVFSAVYEDDVDLGNDIYYTASGGREEPSNSNDMKTKTKKGRSQAKVQVSDQQLTRCNKALAVSCWAKFNGEIGASAGENWSCGKPVRLLRSGNGRRASDKSSYLPKIGVRYDGIYKVVKYWPEIGQSGYRIWRFHLRRDDSAPAPWTTAGRNWSRRLGLRLIYPPNWSQDIAAKRSWKVDQKYLQRQQFWEDRKKTKNENFDRSNKRRKIVKVNENCRFQVPSKILDLIEQDVQNKKLWKSLLLVAEHNGKETFYRELRKSFVCVCCLETIIGEEDQSDVERDPITTECGHNFCRQCLQSSIELTGLVQCPTCRTKFTSSSHKTTNHQLKQILVQLNQFNDKM